MPHGTLTTRYMIDSCLLNAREATVYAIQQEAPHGLHQERWTPCITKSNDQQANLQLN